MDMGITLGIVIVSFTIAFSRPKSVWSVLGAIVVMTVFAVFSMMIPEDFFKALIGR